MRGMGMVIACVSIQLSASAAAADAAAQLRFLHALPGGPDATLQVAARGGEPVRSDPTGFAEATEYARVPSGAVTISLVVEGRRLVSTRTDLRDGGRFTVLAGKGDPAQLRVYPDGTGRAGEGRIRVVHAAPELERSEFKLGARELGVLGEGASTAYATADPGSYPLAAMRPGEADPIVEAPDVSVAAGTASTAYLVGSGGERARFVVLEDAVAAPARAPATGLGGLSRDEPAWLLALLAAVCAGALGGGAYLLAARSGRARA